MSDHGERTSIASMLARTCEDQRTLLQQQHDELTRARQALSTASCPQSDGEELGDAICRLAGERDHARAQIRNAESQIALLMHQRHELRRMMTEMGRALGIPDPDTPVGRHQTMHRVLHLAARQPQPIAP